MGRNAKPPDEKKLTGNPGKRPARAPSKTPTTPDPQAPKLLPPIWLTGDIARAEWDRLSSHLTRSHVMAETDRTTLAQYCMALQRWVAAQEDMATKGTTFVSTSKHGELLRLNPAFKIAESASKEMARLSAQLGLGALARFRLGGAAANVGVQLDLFGGVESKTGKPDETTPKAPAAEDKATTFFGYH